MIENEPKNNSDNFAWRLLDVFLRWRRLLLTNAFIAMVLTFAVLKIFFPNWFNATTTIMPPEKDSGALGMLGGLMPSGLSSLLGGGGLALPGLASPSDLYASVLQSNSVTSRVIEKNNLKEVYDADFDIDALAELAKRTAILVQPEGIIVLSYEDTDPERAAVVANCYVEELNRVNQESLTSKAKAMRVFIEGRLDETIRDLTAAEEAYKAFQVEHNAVSLDDQIKAVINSIAELRGQLVMAEIELGVMKKSLSPDNARYKAQEFKINQIELQLEKMEVGDSSSVGSVLDVPMEKAPELGLQYARLLRELKIQQTIFELLKQQYEQAKIQELKDTPTVQVLDTAKPPEKKSRPHRLTTSVLAAILSFGVTFMLILLVEYYEREKKRDSGIYYRMTAISNMLNEDLYWIRRMFARKERGNGG